MIMNLIFAFGGAMPVFAVSTAKGPDWDYARGTREQRCWQEHADFADRLVEQAPDEDAARAIFDPDPWTVHGVFRIKDVRAWSLWLDGRSR
jgi:hypothetical protein